MPNTCAVSDEQTRKRDRKYDLVLYGATGFTGKLVAEYLLRHYGDSDLKLALAARNERKLENVRSDLKRVHERAGELDLLVADSQDRDALDAIVKETSVLCTTVGPYAKYGEKVASACADAGTDYCDLTGETQFIRRSIDANHERAQETGARLVHCCGYDSIPSDLGTLMVQDAAADRHGASCRQVKYFAGETSGSFSGGTLASMYNIFEEVKRDPSVRKILGNPYSLDTDPKFRGPDGPDQTGVKYDDDLGMWTAPFLMAAINTRVVRRSHALMGRPWGRDFRYSEVMSTGRGPSGMTRALAVTAGMGTFAAGVAVPMTRKVIQKRLPQPGEGPSKEAREKGFFVTRLIGLGVDQEGQRFVVKGEVRGDKDPGYGGTAIMLSESALTLALDRETHGGPGGVLTPATALGMHCVGRLRDAGMTFALTN